MTSATSTLQSAPAWRQHLAAGIYLAAALILFGTAMHLLYRSELPWPLLAVAATGFALLVGFPLSPVLGIAGYLVLAHGSSRYGPLLDVLLKEQLLTWVCALLVLGMLTRWIRQRERPLIGRGPSALLLLFLLWAGVSLAISIVANPTWEMYSRHHPLFYVQGLVLFLLATQTLREPARAWLLALLVCAIPVSHWLLYPPSTFYLEGDLALLAALATAGAAAGIAGAPTRLHKILFTMAGVNGLVILLITHNRGAAVALAAGLLALWLSSRHKWRALAWFGVIALAVALIATPRAYWERFAALWNPQASHATATLDRDTAHERVDLWRAGAEMVRDAPWFGVGPGNFPNAIAFYERSASGLPAHNSIVGIAAETGVPGLMLYLALVLSVLSALVRALGRGREPDPGRRAMLQWLLAGTVAYWVGSMVLTRYDAPIFYLLLGWAVAATHPSAGRGRHRTLPPQHGNHHKASAAADGLEQHVAPVKVL